MAKWTIYKLVDGEEQYVNQSDGELLMYNFPRNETTSDDIYVIKYKNGDIEESVQHRVVTGSCATISTDCNCDNIISDNKAITLGDKKGSSFSKPCYLTNGCPAYFEIIFQDVDGEWLDLDYTSDGFIVLTALSDATGIRQATVRVCYDEGRMHECYSFNVTQNAKTTYNVMYEVQVSGIEKFQLTGVDVIVDNQIKKTINLKFTGNSSSYGYTSGSTTVSANSIAEAISKLDWGLNNSEIIYPPNSINYRLKYTSEESRGDYRNIRYEAAQVDYDIDRPNMQCMDKPRTLCACGQAVITKDSGTRNRAAVINKPSTNNVFDIVMTYMIEGGACR